MLPGQESYVKKPRVWKTSMKPRDAKKKADAVEGGQSTKKAQEGQGMDELKELLGLGDTTPSDVVVETDPLRTGIATALP